MLEVLKRLPKTKRLTQTKGSKYDCNRIEFATTCDEVKRHDGKRKSTPFFTL